MSEQENDKAETPAVTPAVVPAPTPAVATTADEMNLPVEEDVAEPAAPVAEPVAVEAPVVETAEPVEPVERRTGVNPNAEMEKDARSALKPGTDLSDDADFISLLNADIPELNALASNYPNMDFVRTEAGQNWVQLIQQGQNYLMRGQALMGSLLRDGSLWRQSVTSGGEQLQAARPKFGEDDGGKLTGEKAQMRVQALLGLGQVVRIPLWHTGIWVTLKAPTEASLLELDRRIASEKILLGRQSNGMIFSNSSVYTTSFLVNFALAHVYDSSVKTTTPEELKKIIKTTDIPTLVWGLLCTIYPSGYPFKQPCVTDPSKCNHVTEELLNISKLSWTDDRKLSDWQRRQMVRKTAKFTPEELKRYSEEHSYDKFSTVTLRDGLVMELKVPTVEEYEIAGFTWVDSITKQIDNAFGGTIKGEERNRYILEQGQVTALRQYSHWISRLVLGGTEYIDDATSIEDSIATLTSDDGIFKSFFEGIGTFIDNTTLSLIALPKFNCPACDKPMSEDEKAHPHLIVLDVANIFFTLQDHRIYKVLQRSQL